MPSPRPRVCNSYATSGRTKSSASVAGQPRLRLLKRGFRSCNERGSPFVARTHRRTSPIVGPGQNPYHIRLDKQQRISKIFFPKSGSNSVVECDLAKVEVASSNLVSRSKNSGANREAARTEILIEDFTRRFAAFARRMHVTLDLKTRSSATMRASQALLISGERLL
jgi:hypothetical protein